MESNGKFTLIVFNTCTQEYEEVIVTEEVYRTYCRTRWNIKDNDQSFFDHEIQTSGMIGSQDGAYENFREFIDAINTPEHIILEQMKKEALYQAISALPAADQALVQGLFFKGQSELDYVELDERWLFDLAKDPEGRKPTVTWQSYNRSGVLYESYDEMFISLLPRKVENPELKRILRDYFRIRSQKKKVAKSITVYQDAAERFGD